MAFFMQKIMGTKLRDIIYDEEIIYIPKRKYYGYDILDKKICDLTVSEISDLTPYICDVLPSSKEYISPCGLIEILKRNEFGLKADKDFSYLKERFKK